MELLLQGDFLGLIKAEVFVSASYDFVSFSGASFYVRVTVDLSGINAVRFRGGCDGCVPLPLRLQNGLLCELCSAFGITFISPLDRKPCIKIRYE